MSLRISPTLLSRVHQHVQEGYPHEVVGILAGDRASNTVHEVKALINERADSAHNRYRVGGLVLLRAESALVTAGHEIVGYYHSHPDHPAQYSQYDRDHAWPHMSYVIISCDKGEIAKTLSWRLVDDRSAMTPETILIEEY